MQTFIKTFLIFLTLACLSSAFAAPALSQKDKFLMLCAKKDTTLAEAELKKGNFDTRWKTQVGINGLGIALLRFDQNPQFIKALLDAGFKIEDAFPKKSKGALLVSIISNKSPEITKLLIEHGANPNAKNANGRTAMHFAAESERGSEYIKVLKDAGADLNAKDIHGLTPAWVAFFTGRNVNYMKDLKSFGANLDERDENGLTMYMRVLNAEEIDNLAKAGANPNETDPAGRTPLMRFILAGAPVEILEALLRAGTNIDMRDNSGRTALILAIINGNIDAQKILKAAGADESIEDNDGKTAAYYKNPDKINVEAPSQE